MTGLNIHIATAAVLLQPLSPVPLFAHEDATYGSVARQLVETQMATVLNDLYVPATYEEIYLTKILNAYRWAPGTTTTQKPIGPGASLPAFDPAANLKQIYSQTANPKAADPTLRRAAEDAAARLQRLTNAGDESWAADMAADLSKFRD